MAKLKSCRNCAGPVPPATKMQNIRKKVFCSDNCRKEFHKNNGISLHKLKDQVQRWVRATVREEWAKIQEENRAA